MAREFEPTKQAATGKAQGVQDAVDLHHFPDVDEQLEQIFNGRE